MPRYAYVLLAAIAIAGVAAGGWRLWQLWRVHMFYEEMRRSRGAGEPLQPSSRHLQAIRLLRFAWDPLVENGEPMVDPFAPYGSADVRDDLGPIIGTRDMLAIAKFHAEVSRALIWALKYGELPEGRYPIAHLDDAGMDERILRLAGYRHKLVSEQIAMFRDQIPRLDPNGTFLVTDTHRRLLKHLNLIWPPRMMRNIPGRSIHPTPRGNGKRPFGDSTVFEFDMAAILGLPAPTATDDIQGFWKLYMQMWPALQAFVEHARIPVRPE